jgi:hypothetical protein
MKLCATCKHFKRHKETMPRFVFGWWMGDGKCEVDGEQKFPYTVTVDSDGCEKHEEGDES